MLILNLIKKELNGFYSFIFELQLSSEVNMAKKYRLRLEKVRNNAKKLPTNVNIKTF